VDSSPARFMGFVPTLPPALAEPGGEKKHAALNFSEAWFPFSVPSVFHLCSSVAKNWATAAAITLM
jgi:hypothetical protein